MFRPRSFAHLALGLALIGLLLPAPVAAKQPKPELLGIRLGMDDSDALRRLGKLGKSVTRTDLPKQTWDLRDRRFSQATIRFNHEWKVYWMTVFARLKRVRYRDFGDLAKAHRSGKYIYTWTLALQSGRPCAITARGSDSIFVSSVSIHPPGPSANNPPETGHADSLAGLSAP